MKKQYALLLAALLLLTAVIPAQVLAAQGQITVHASTLPEQNHWTVRVGENRVIDLAALFTDAEGHSLTFSYTVKNGSGQTVNLSQTHFSPTQPTKLSFSAEQAGEYTLTLQAACTQCNCSETAVITVTAEAAAEGLPVQYSYDETPADSVTVFVTLSSDGIPLKGNDEDSTLLSHLEVTVPYFDLGLYDLQHYYRYGTDGGHGGYTGTEVIRRPTAMHLCIYLLERYYMGLEPGQCGKGQSDVIDHDGGYGVENMLGEDAYDDTLSAVCYTGGATSSYMKNFWGHDENLLYYRNHVFPLQSAGWGSTSDYILLSDGDTIDIAMFTDWGFYQNGSFCTFVDRDTSQNDGVTNESCLDIMNRPDSAFTACTGTEKIFSAVRFGTGVAEGGSDAFTPSDTDERTANLSVAVYDENWNDVTENKNCVTSWTDDGKGHYAVTFAKAGTYYLLGMDAAGGTDEACIAPATAKLVVTDEQTLPGDVNGDGKVNALDASLVLQYAAGLPVSVTATAGDVNNDGKTNALDASLILQYAAGLVPGLPINKQH